MPQTHIGLQDYRQSIHAGRTKPIIGQTQVPQARFWQQHSDERLDALGRHVVVTKVEVGQRSALGQRGQQQNEMGRVESAMTKAYCGDRTCL